MHQTGINFFSLNRNRFFWCWCWCCHYHYNKCFNAEFFRIYIIKWIHLYLSYLSSSVKIILIEKWNFRFFILCFSFIFYSQGDYIKHPVLYELSHKYGFTDNLPESALPNRLEEIKEAIRREIRKELKVMQNNEEEKKFICIFIIS